MRRQCLTTKNKPINIRSQSELSARKCDSDQFTISINTEDSDVDINISPLDLQIFLSNNLEYIADNLGDTKAQLELIRAPGYLIKKIDDATMQSVLIDLTDDVLVHFLWYMKDEELIELIMRNLSRRAGEVLLEDLECFVNQDPDKAVGTRVKRSHEAIAQFTGLFRDILA